MSRGNERLTTTTGGRSAFIDNAKAGLIALVVFTHLFSIHLGREEPAHSAYLFILLFHMPAFVFVTGWLAKPYEFTLDGAAALRKIVWMYLLFNTLNYVWGYLFFDTRLKLAKVLFDPVFALWFLLAMVWWRISLPLFAQGRSTWAALASVALAVTVSVGSGYVIGDGEWMAVARTATFLPFYVAGYRARQMGWSLPRAWWSRLAAVALMLAVFAALATGVLALTPELLFGRVNYAELGTGGASAALQRLGWLTLSAGLVGAVLQLVPSRATLVTGLGASTLSVYVWHALFVRNIKHFDLTHIFAGTAGGLLLTTAALVVVAGFGPVPRLTHLLSGTSHKKGGA